MLSCPLNMREQLSETWVRVNVMQVGSGELDGWDSVHEVQVALEKNRLVSSQALGKPDQRSCLGDPEGHKKGQCRRRNLWPVEQEIIYIPYVPSNSPGSSGPHSHSHFQLRPQGSWHGEKSKGACPSGCLNLSGKLRLLHSHCLCSLHARLFLSLDLSADPLAWTPFPTFSGKPLLTVSHTLDSSWTWSPFSVLPKLMSLAFLYCSHWLPKQKVTYSKKGSSLFTLCPRC